MPSHQSDLDRFYELLGRLALAEDGPRTLAKASKRDGWPDRGVYFFMEAGETRRDSAELRVVRVGTHALRRGSGTTLWGRLSQHRGQVGGRHPGGGNHRGSIFRLLVGTSLIARGALGATEAKDTWGRGATAPPGARESEDTLEGAVSEQIGSMPVLWLEIGDEPGPESQRGLIERNAIGLLSHMRGTERADPASGTWLGKDCDRAAVRASGLWNQQHVDEPYDPGFLDAMERLVRAQGAAS